MQMRSLKSHWSFCSILISRAGSGYFRIFNPTTQGEKFDREGEFIRQWLPELRDVPGKVVHEPWKWAQKAGVTLDYPQPIVDHKEARLRTLAAYEEARKGA